jgi:Major capsid protein Gp23
MIDKELQAGITDLPDRRKEAARLVQKWERTGLLEGLSDKGKNKNKSNMARLLESEARHLLTEATADASIIGFQNVAFPIVRRVFAGLIANELVSVQPMSLPSGLLFYIDYQFGSTKAGDKTNNFATGGSLFGDVTGPTQTGGMSALGTNGLYNLGTSYSQREKVATGTFSGTIGVPTLSTISWDPELSGVLAAGNLNQLTVVGGFAAISGLADCASDLQSMKQWVPLSASSTAAAAATGAEPGGTGGTDGTPVQLGTCVIYRRHTQVAANGNDVIFIYSGSTNLLSVPATAAPIMISYVAAAKLNGGTSGTLSLPEFESDFNNVPTPAIPEINLAIQSLSVNANTRKLRAKWTPELAQDLAAYQNLDAEVELTQVLSEEIALEIDREVLADLLWNASGANFFWSRKPGNFVDKTTGNSVSGASFTGTVREWYETLVETIIDVANNIHRKTLRGAANWVVTSPDVSTILEASVLYKPVLSMDPKETMYSVGTEKVGTINNRFTVYKDPYFPRNRILVGFKGSSFLETGYVYAPYVPLIVTPTIYAPEDFTPRKGVMTRYGKKMVRSDFFGTVVVQDLNVI